MLLAVGGLLLAWLVKTTDKFAQFRKELGEALGGIKNALLAGDIPAAARVLWAAINLEWTRGMQALGRKWRSFWADIGIGLRGYMADIDVALGLQTQQEADQMMAEVVRGFGKYQAGDPAEMAQAEAELARAKAEFDAAVKAAGAAGGEGPSGDLAHWRTPGIEKALSKAGVIGSFNAARLLGFQAGGPTDRLIELGEKEVEELKKLNQKFVPMFK